MKVKCKCSGFTILELLVASTLTVLISGLVLGLTRTILANWNVAAARFEIEERARGALDLMEKDLVAWVAGRQSHLVIFYEETGPVGAMHSIRLLSRETEDVSDHGDVVSCLYWLESGSGLWVETDEIAHLFRGCVDGQATWEAYYVTNSSETMSGPLDMLTDRFKREDVFLLRNCIGLYLQAWVIGADGKAIALSGARSPDAVLRKPGDVLSFPLVVQDKGYAIPAYIDVTLWMLAEEGARLLREQGAINRSDGSEMNVFYRQYVTPVTQRIVFRSEGR